MTAAINSVDSELKSGRLAAVRQEMARRGVAAFCVPRADEFLGEYIPVHNERLRWLSGFTGSAGMGVVLAESAAIFVDGRYTVQVRRQVDAASYRYEHLIENPPLRWLAAQLPPGASVLLDPRMCSLSWYREAREILDRAQIRIELSTLNPVDLCWTDRPAPAIELALLLDQQFSGEASVSKRRRIGSAIADADAQAALIFAPDSVSWLLNVRGRDVPRLPVLLSFAILEASGVLHLVVDLARIPEGFAEHVGEGVMVVPEGEAEDLLGRWSGRTMLADPQGASAWTQLALEAAGATLKAAEDPVVLPKACKNPVEIDGARRAHQRDAVAEIRFLAWLDREVAAGRYHDEATLSERLGTLRAQGEHYHEPSFDTISAAGSNAAMCHYNHADNRPAMLSPNSLYLVDSGGQYSDGTTDITRTVAIGQPSDEMRALFTLVLKGHIALGRARFPRGTTGTHLDVLARQFLWQTGRDYDHGTGHGVGAFLSVHEGPQRISRAWSAAVLAPGMIVSNEPGYYRDNEFGIRCENLCVVTEVDAQSEVPMLCFEVLTLVPFDTRLIDIGLLDDIERTWIDGYHARVQEVIGARLDNADDRAWLDAATAPLPRG